MMAAVKRLVGVDRSAPASASVPPLDREALEKPITKARERLEAASAAHQEALDRVAAVAAEVREAEAALDNERTDRNADRVLDLERDKHRAEKLSASTQRDLDKARVELERAQKTRDDAITAHLLERVRTAPERAEALWNDKGYRGLQLLVAFVDELDDLIADARAAAVEANRGDSNRQYAETMGIEAIRSIVRELANKDCTPAALIKIERLVG